MNVEIFYMYTSFTRTEVISFKKILIAKVYIIYILKGKVWQKYGTTLTSKDSYITCQLIGYSHIGKIQNNSHCLTKILQSLP